MRTCRSFVLARHCRLGEYPSCRPHPAKKVRVGASIGVKNACLVSCEACAEQPGLTCVDVSACAPLAKLHALASRIQECIGLSVFNFDVVVACEGSDVLVESTDGSANSTGCQGLKSWWLSTLTTCRASRAYRTLTACFSATCCELRCHMTAMREATHGETTRG